MFNGMRDAQVERLFKLSEELHEVGREISMCLLHGWESSDPTRPVSNNNKENLELELGDLWAVADYMIACGDLDRQAIQDQAKRKTEFGRLSRYLHHQPATAFANSDMPAKPKPDLWVDKREAIQAGLRAANLCVLMLSDGTCQIRPAVMGEAGSIVPQVFTAHPEDQV